MVNSNTKKNTKKNTTSPPSVSRSSTKRSSTKRSSTKRSSTKKSSTKKSQVKIMPKMKKLNCLNLFSERSKLEMIMNKDRSWVDKWLKDCDHNGKLRPKYEKLLRGIKPKSWSEEGLPKWSPLIRVQKTTRRSPNLWKFLTGQQTRSDYFARS